MICPRCKVKLVSDVPFCPRCGLLFKSNIVEKVSSKTSVDGYIHYYIKEYAKGNNLPRISLLYILFPFNLPFLHHLPFLSINLTLIVFHALFALTYIVKKSGPFAALYVLFSIFAIFAYYIWNIITYNRSRLDISTIRILKARRDYGDEKAVEICEKDGKGNILLFVLSFVFMPILLLIFIFILDLLTRYL